METINNLQNYKTLKQFFLGRFLTIYFLQQQKSPKSAFEESKMSRATYAAIYTTLISFSMIWSLRELKSRKFLLLALFNT